VRRAPAYARHGVAGDHVGRSMVIIGAGMGGLAAGIYGQINGYDTRIFEMHNKPGGQCASWKRGGYTFDACIHHLFGCRPGSAVHRLWHELGVMPRELVPVEECTAVAAPDGKMFVDYYDPERLRKTLLDLAPVDATPIDDYVRSVRAFAKKGIGDAMLSDSLFQTIVSLPSMLSTQKWMKVNMGQYAQRFSDPFLKRAFPLLVYSQPEVSLFFHLLRHAAGLDGDIQWPAGGAAEFARSMERRYLGLGGEVHYSSPVEKILVEHDRAVGVRLADGGEHKADLVVSDADGRKTIFELLGGTYVNDIVRGYCLPLSDVAPFAVDVFLGVDRDLSAEPSSLALLLDEPFSAGGHTHESIEIQIYGFDRTMAPPGKGVIKVEYPDSWAYWKRLHQTDRDAYKREKQAMADRTVELLGGYFPGIREQVEVTDVCTLPTWERYMGGSQGWFNLPNRKMSLALKDDPADKKFISTLPGLSGFYFVGVWVTMMGSLFHNAHSGKALIRRLCKKDGKAFRATA